MHTYDDHCDFTLENLWNDVDHYFLVHVCNWFLATFVIRDAYILHLWSFLDEIVELSWQHILPHFRECWWDHIFMDISFSNTPSIIFGLWFIKKAGFKQYDWFGRKGKNSFFDWDIWTW
jgi:phosphatidylserine synthase 2